MSLGEEDTTTTTNTPPPNATGIVSAQERIKEIMGQAKFAPVQEEFGRIPIYGNYNL